MKSRRLMAQRPEAVFRTKRAGVVRALLLLPMAALMIGCFDNESKPTHIVPPPLTPDEVVRKLEDSWNQFYYDSYQSILSDSFTFVFAPQDAGGPDNNPPTWGRTDELLSAQHMFSKNTPNRDGYIARNALLTFQIGADSSNNMNGWTKIVLSQIFLTVSTRQETTQDPLDYLVQGDQANLWLDQENGEWKIIRWEDKPIGALGIRPSTWGSIKRLFR